MGQATVGSDGIYEGQKGHSETRGNEDILYKCLHFYEMKSGSLLMARTIDRVTCRPGNQKEPRNRVQIRTIPAYRLLQVLATV